MNPETVKRLCEINNDFYRRNAASFSQTRRSPWPGWTDCLKALRGVWAAEDGRSPTDERQNLSVLDLACGNLRFETFLNSALPKTTLTFYAVDNCDSIVPKTPYVNYQSLDILNLLQNDLPINDHLAAPLCDLAVAFGLMHHVPRQKYRETLLASLARQTRHEGFVIVSFWQFLNNEAMAKRARVTHEHALEELGLEALDNNDYLLGWKNTPGVYRYCHSFSEAEIDQLVESVAQKTPLSVVSRFTTDGRTNNLNTYLVLRVL
jgi:SAM-dependent methyltransferase